MTFEKKKEFWSLSDSHNIVHTLNVNELILNINFQGAGPLYQTL